MFKALGLFIILITSVPAQDICSAKGNPESKLGPFEKLIYFIAKNSRQRANPNEAKFFANNLLSTLSLKELTIIAVKQSQIYCQAKWIDRSLRIKETEDNEVDAIRHFILSTLLSYQAPDKALPILFNHEIDGKHPLNKQNLMDLHNNQMGIQFGEELRARKMKLSKDDIAFLALEKAISFLKMKELSVLNPMNHGPCSTLYQRSENEIKSSLRKHKKNYDFLQRSCIGPILECGLQ